MDVECGDKALWNGRSSRRLHASLSTLIECDIMSEKGWAWRQPVCTYYCFFKLGYLIRQFLLTPPFVHAQRAFVVVRTLRNFQKSQAPKFRSRRLQQILTHGVLYIKSREKDTWMHNQVSKSVQVSFFFEIWPKNFFSDKQSNYVDRYRRPCGLRPQVKLFFER